ncbi:hypothetical protein I5Q82_16485 [Acutalibacter muris]|jgi:hypothetical protein|uniref:Uncharacterized protein n=1 Tax=Acutalibacter muris TaxID=1796620 RepID=A0AA92L6M3_9FIRM|nr:hypothetical protein [Acutalibacter muris]ANU53003.1 hypothetical protein A4V00_02625 [Hungateiclostridiaceae bacterium KB18]MCI9192442.1 hypothetical protein [Acutalibacter muris]MCI9542800.1 hypothetical protein [Acutalibacter muris]QQR29612.1 hypothetical protein I5Q82_16485 [Acutalibacter muris]
MFPYQWGSVSAMGYPGSGMMAGLLPVDYPGYRDLPEEIRSALEERQKEIHSEADMRRLIDELMLRR